MFFKKNKKEDEDKNFVKIASLLIHAAKIDENFTLKEEEIIKKTLSILGAKKDDLNKIIEQGKILENDSNQILTFTKNHLKNYH